MDQSAPAAGGEPPSASSKASSRGGIRRRRRSAETRRHLGRIPLPAPPTWLLLGAALAIAGAGTWLRLVRIDALGFNSDEAVYAGQAAAIAGVPKLDAIFPVFRAHPLLFQLAVSVLYSHFGVSDLTPRLLAVGFGLATVLVGYAIGSRLYGRPAGLATSLFLAVMPYLVVVNRQALLDGPMTLFAAITLYCLVRYGSEGRPIWLYATGGALGLTFLSKETGLLMIPAASAFLALAYSIRVRLRDLGVSLLLFVLVALPYPLSLMLAGGSGTGKDFLVWQLFRPSNHVWTFYFTVVPAAISLPIVVAAAGGVAAALGRGWRWRETLLACWVAVPFLFFQLWPVKGYEYLLPISVPVAVLAAAFVTDRPLWAAVTGRLRLGLRLPVVHAILVVGVAAAAGVACWSQVNAQSATTFLAGTGGVPGGREAGRWMLAHTPVGAEALSIGPSMANILEFYGERQLLGLSVSPNPLHRNPAYTPVVNADVLLRTGQVQYVVWDAYSASRSPFFAQKLLADERRYNGVVVHVESVAVQSGGHAVERPVIVIYQVRP